MNNSSKHCLRSDWVTAIVCILKINEVLKEEYQRARTQQCVQPKTRMNRSFSFFFEGTGDKGTGKNHRALKSYLFI